MSLDGIEQNKEDRRLYLLFAEAISRAIIEERVEEFEEHLQVVMNATEILENTSGEKKQ
jgi:hypothetical protein